MTHFLLTTYSTGLSGEKWGCDYALVSLDERRRAELRSKMTLAQEICRENAAFRALVYDDNTARYVAETELIAGGLSRRNLDLCSPVILGNEIVKSIPTESYAPVEEGRMVVSPWDVTWSFRPSNSDFTIETGPLGRKDLAEEDRGACQE